MACLTTVGSLLLALLGSAALSALLLSKGSATAIAALLCALLLDLNFSHTVQRSGVCCFASTDWQCSIWSSVSCVAQVCLASQFTQTKSSVLKAT